MSAAGTKAFDLIVLGGGSAGFAAAIQGHELGKRVLMVNSGTIGGTCVNVGCVPLKTLIRAAEAAHRGRQHSFAGIAGEIALTDFGKVIGQKDALVAQLRQAKYVDVLHGYRYIALEIAQMFARFGIRVTVLQRSERILPTEDPDLTGALTSYLRDEGLRVETSVRIGEVKRNGAKVVVRARVGDEDEDKKFEAEQILCATGRRANTKDLGLEEIGVRLSENGDILVDDTLQTTCSGIFAAGDVIGEPAFVYTAAYEGRLAAANALTPDTGKRDYRALPWVIFSDPQVAGVGMNELEAAGEGLEVDVATLDLKNVPRALAARDTRGFIKLLRRRGSDELVGARILAPEGGEQIMEAALAIRHGIGVSELAAAFHPYLTQAEGIKLCAQTFGKDVTKLSCCSA